jgi:hypothetical protein
MHYTEVILVEIQVGRKEMKVTNYMIMKWSKAALLIIFGIIFIYFMDPINLELRDLFSQFTQGHEMPGLFDLSYAVYFIIALWCFVDAALNILTSFREQKMTMDDLGVKLDAIEKKLLSANVPQMPGQPGIPQRPMVVQQESVAVEEPVESPTPAPPTDVPPPP